MNEELVSTIKEMYLFLSERAETVGMSYVEPHPIIMSHLEFEYKLTIIT